MARVSATVAFLVFFVPIATGCGGAKPCTTCPNVGGCWTLTFTQLSAPSNNCVWGVTTNTPYAMAITQTPSTGSSISVSVGSLVFSGTIDVNNQISASTTGTTTCASDTVTTSDSLALNLSADGNSFTGSWQETKTDTNSSAQPSTTTTCSGNAQLSGQKQ
jgi:hypothetical protein